MGCIFYEVDEVFNEAVMTGVPSIIVEGVDDIGIYVNLAKKAPFDVEVYAVEHIDGYGQGCDEVIRAIGDLEKLPDSSHKLCSNVLGIIDKDVREFRGELPESDSMLVLKYYSIESHFVSKHIVEHTLKLCTKASRDMVSDQLCGLIMNEIEDKLEKLYYFSLEALRNAVERDYVGDFAYSFSPGRVNDENAEALVAAKIESLDAFAEKCGVSRSIGSIKSIAKGKWLIDVFAEELVACIDNLQGLCKLKKIESCRSCLAAAHEKCLYRIKEGIGKKAVKSLATAEVGGGEFDYIVDRISRLKGK